MLEFSFFDNHRFQVIHEESFDIFSSVYCSYLGYQPLKDALVIRLKSILILPQIQDQDFSPFRFDPLSLKDCHYCSESLNRLLEFDHLVLNLLFK